MMKFEKELAGTLGEEYKNLISANGGISALHAANLVLGYGKDERKTLECVVRIIELSTQILQVLPGKVAVASDMGEEQIIKWTPHSSTIQINIKYLREKNSQEDARKLMIAVHTAVFIKHVKAIAESSNETVHTYAEKMGWYSEWKNPVDPLENPRLFFEQKYVKDALAYGIAYTESAMLQMEQSLQNLKEKNNG